MPLSAAELNAAIASVPRPLQMPFGSWMSQPFSSLPGYQQPSAPLHGVVEL
jgi:hypothetical protein